MEANYWSSRLSRRTLVRGAALGGAGLAGAALIGCGSDEDRTPAATATASATTAATATGTPDPLAGIKTGGTYRYHQTGDPTTIDPFGNASFTVKGYAAHIYSRLYKIAARADANPNAVPSEPDIAESAETSDGQHWVVKLKQGIKFQNVAPVSGREVTTDDVLFSWDRLTDESSANRGMVSDFVGVEAVDDYTLEFTLNGPSATFLDTLSDTNVLFVMPREADGGFNPKETSIGSGPFMLDEYQTSVAVKFKKNPDYWDAPRPYVDAIEHAIIPEYANSLAQYQAGNLHTIEPIAEDVLPLRDQIADVQFRGNVNISLSHIYFSGEDMSPDAPWRDERFRQALSMAINRDEMTELLYNNKVLEDAGLDVSKAWNSAPAPVGFTRWWLDPQGPEQGPSAKFFEYNPTEAKALLAAAGFEGIEFPFIYTNNRYGARFNTGTEAVIGWIGELGLKPKVETQDYNAVYITQTFAGNFHGVALGPETPFPEIGGWINRLYGPDPNNHGRVSDDVITALNAKQKVELDEESRRGFIHDIVRRNSEMMYYIPTQLGAGTIWRTWQPPVRGIIWTRGYGRGTEELPYVWLDS